MTRDFDIAKQGFRELRQSVVYKKPFVARLGYKNPDGSISVSTTGCPPGYCHIYQDTDRFSTRVRLGSRVNPQLSKNRVRVGYLDSGQAVAFETVDDDQSAEELGANVSVSGTPPGGKTTFNTAVRTDLLCGGRVLPYAGLTMWVEEYPPAGLMTEATYDGTARIPGSSGEHRWFGVYIDTNRTPSAVDGAALVLASVRDLREQDAYALIAAMPEDVYPLFAVSASNGQTDFATSRFVDLRLHHGKTPGANIALPGYGAQVTKTIASGVLDIGTDRNIIVAAESGTADTVDTLTGLDEGESALFQADTGDTITFAHGVDNVFFYNADDLAITGAHLLTLYSPDGVNAIQPVDQENTGGGGGWLDAVAVAPTGTDDDAFNDASLDGAWTLVERASAPQVTVTEAKDVLSILCPTASSTTGEVHALLKSIGSLTTGQGIETAARLLSQNNSEPAVGLIFSDGVTYGAGNQVVAKVYRSAANDLAEVRIASSTNFNTAGSGTTKNYLHHAHGWLFMRLYWQSANTWRIRISPDGVSWLTDFPDLSFTMTPTHMGVFMNGASAASGADTVATFEYFKVI